MTTKLKPTIRLPTKTLDISGNYDQFSDFYDVNKETIFRSIFDVFKEFKKPRKKKVNLYVKAKIQGLDWDSEFEFERENIKVLKKEVIPFFESIEDYETCGEINELFNKLTN